VWQGVENFFRFFENREKRLRAFVESRTNLLERLANE
jgi:hypothetical protein